MDPTPGTRECPHPNCPRRIGDDEFACRHHWFTLPQQIRADITGRYRTAQRAALTQAMREAAEHWVADGAKQ